MWTYSRCSFLFLRSLLNWTFWTNFPRNPWTNIWFICCILIHNCTIESEVLTGVKILTFEDAAAACDAIMTGCFAGCRTLVFTNSTEMPKDLSIRLAHTCSSAIEPGFCRHIDRFSWLFNNMQVEKMPCSNPFSLRTRWIFYDITLVYDIVWPILWRCNVPILLNNS